ncbi:hypothetical protein PSENEW3_00005750 [Picochlorum sp. SENEW3]|nr:hypothetical protein PSENEW3_00005750 [Picochlorum sp. SENEW3]
MKWSVFVVCAALLASVARAQDPDVALAANQTEERLLTSIRDPIILDRTGDAITVGFITGPNLPKTQFVVKCVAGDGDCDAPAQGVSAEGELPLKKAEIEATVEGLDPDAAYSCFVEAFYRPTGKLNICKKAADQEVFSVRATFTFDGFADADAFTAADREQLCINLNTISPGGICVVEKVESGSAIPTVRNDYTTPEGATLLDEGLIASGTFVQETLVQGLSQPTTVTVDSIETSGNVPPPPPGYSPNPPPARRLNRRRLFDMNSDIGF